MASCEKVIIRLRDNSFGPVPRDGGRCAHSGQLVVRSGGRACLLPNAAGGDEVLRIKYEVVQQILMRYQGKSVREIVSNAGNEDDVVSLSGQLHREMDSPVFTVCADTWKNDEGKVIDCLRIDTGNIMGSLRLRVPESACIVELQIGSRFDTGKDQLFLNYLLGKAMGVDFSDFVDSGSASFMQILLAILLVRAMSEADKVGLLREYRRYDCRADCLMPEEALQDSVSETTSASTNQEDFIFENGHNMLIVNILYALNNYRLKYLGSGSIPYCLQSSLP